jgi:hypothetical protein
MTLVAAGMTFAWPHARTQASLIVIAALYGQVPSLPSRPCEIALTYSIQIQILHSVVSGTYVSTFPLPIFALGEVADVGRRTGMALTIAALGALAGPPISGAINTATGGFEAVGFYAGGTILLSVGMMVVTRQLRLGRVWGRI